MSSKKNGRRKLKNSLSENWNGLRMSKQSQCFSLPKESSLWKPYGRQFATIGLVHWIRLQKTRSYWKETAHLGPLVVWLALQSPITGWCLSQWNRILLILPQSGVRSTNNQNCLELFVVSLTRDYVQLCPRGAFTGRGTLHAFCCVEASALLCRWCASYVLWYGLRGKSIWLPLRCA